MGSDIVNRYETYAGKQLAVDVSVGRVEELYEDFDSAASYVRKDLDQDFVDYLIESVRELRNNDFVIRINLPGPVSEKNRQRVGQSIVNYFAYLESVTRQKRQQRIGRSLLMLALGGAFLLLALFFSGFEQGTGEVFHTLIFEGLTIAAWVSMWNAFAYLLFGLAESFGQIRLYRRIAGCEVVFTSREGTTPRETAAAV